MPQKLVLSNKTTLHIRNTRDLEGTVMGSASIFNLILCKIRKLEPLNQQYYFEPKFPKEIWLMWLCFLSGLFWIFEKISSNLTQEQRTRAICFSKLFWKQNPGERSCECPFGKACSVSNYRISVTSCRSSLAHVDW